MFLTLLTSEIQKMYNASMVYRFIINFLPKYRENIKYINFSTGLRPQLLSRLTKLVKAEEDADKKGEGDGDEVMEVPDDDDKKTESDEKKEDSATESHIEIKDDEQGDKKDVQVVETEKPKEEKKKEKTEKEIEEEKKKVSKRSDLFLLVLTGAS